ncbi:MAG: hypothetical protein LBQ42_01865, partial [Synergistaceae bacterium]|nr:hypothetical protein [Synergistaceae bacterium]
MALVVNNNIPALQTYNAVNATTNSLQKSIQKLSTGLRINSAADDAAGLAISEKMRAQTRGLDRAISNSQDGISMLQTAEGALSETHSILQRMRELSVQSANDTLTQQDRGYIQLEIDQLREEITRIANTTQFNKKKLLDGSAAALWSSDKLTTKALVNGGLRSVDQFGQKTSAEGNFIIDVNATPGKAQVQKSDVFTIKHQDVVMNVSTNGQLGINGVSVNNVPAGDYQVTLTDRMYELAQDDSLDPDQRYLAQRLSANIVSLYGVDDGYDWATVAVTDIDDANHTLTLTLAGRVTGAGDQATLVFDTVTGEMISPPDTDFLDNGVYITGSIGANFDTSKVRVATYGGPSSAPSGFDLLPDDGTVINVSIAGTPRTITVPPYPDPVVTFGGVASGSTIDATSDSTLAASLTAGADVNFTYDFTDNAIVAQWLGEHPGYDEVYLRVDVTAVGNPARADDVSNQFTVSLVAKSSTNNSLSPITLAYADINGSLLQDDGVTDSGLLHLQADLDLDDGGPLSGIFTIPGNDLVFAFDVTAPATAAGQYAEYQLNGVNLNGAVTVTTNDDGGSALLARAFADMGFDFSDVTAGGHEISFRVIDN